MSSRSSINEKRGGKSFIFEFDRFGNVCTLESAVADVEIGDWRSHVVVHGNDSNGERLWIGLRRHPFSFSFLRGGIDETRVSFITSFGFLRKGLVSRRFVACLLSVASPVRFLAVNAMKLNVHVSFL